MICTRKTERLASMTVFLIGAFLLPVRTPAQNVIMRPPHRSALHSPRKLVSRVTITRLNWNGWTNCVRLSNGVVEAIIVPRIGRIMAFQYAGHPESSPLFINQEWIGKSGADAGEGNWANFGGDKLWPAPQSDWPIYIRHAWPPDPAFDGQPQRLDIIPQGIRLTTPPSDAFKAGAIREITMRSSEARLYISQTLLRLTNTGNVMPPAQSAPANARLGIWSITQTRGDGTIFLPLNPASRFPGGFVTFDADSRPVRQRAPLPGGWTQSAGVLIGRRDPVTSHKLGTDASAGWLASLYAGKILFSEHYTPLPGQTYPDAGCSSEVYENAGATAYIEMEILGPLRFLKPGDKTAHNLYWQLNRLPYQPVNDTDTVRLVQKTLGGTPPVVHPAR